MRQRHTPETRERLGAKLFFISDCDCESCWMNKWRWDRRVTFWIAKGYPEHNVWHETASLAREEKKNCIVVDIEHNSAGRNSTKWECTNERREEEKKCEWKHIRFYIIPKLNWIDVKMMKITKIQWFFISSQSLVFCCVVLSFPFRNLVHFVSTQQLLWWKTRLLGMRERKTRHHENDDDDGGVERKQESRRRWGAVRTY